MLGYLLILWFWSVFCGKVECLIVIGWNKGRIVLFCIAGHIAIFPLTFEIQATDMKNQT